MGLMGVGMGLSAISSIQQGKQAEASGQWNRDRAYEDAKMIEERGVVDSQRILTAGAEEEARLSKTADARRGSNILSVARSGVLLEGSPLLVMNNIAMETEKEALGIRTDAQSRADDTLYQSKLNARKVRLGGEMSLTDGKFQKSQSYMKAGSTLLQGAGALYGMSGGFGGSKTGSAPSGAFNPRKLAR